MQSVADHILSFPDHMLWVTDHILLVTDQILSITAHLFFLSDLLGLWSPVSILTFPVTPLPLLTQLLRLLSHKGRVMSHPYAPISHWYGPMHDGALSLGHQARGAALSRRSQVDLPLSSSRSWVWLGSGVLKDAPGGRPALLPSSTHPPSMHPGWGSSGGCSPGLLSQTSCRAPRPRRCLTRLFDLDFCGVARNGPEDF